MRETNFIKQNREKWQKFENLLTKVYKDPRELSKLFTQITDDLSFARTFYPNRSVRVYLNGLSQKIFFNIYKARKVKRGRFMNFWTTELPQIVYESRKDFRLSLGVFLVAMLIGAISCHMDPTFAEAILGESYIDMTLTNIDGGDPMAVYKSSKETGMFLGIAANNLRVALMTFGMGVLFMIGTIYMLISNGVMVGAFQYFFVQQDDSIHLDKWDALGIISLVVLGVSFLFYAMVLLDRRRVKARKNIVEDAPKETTGKIGTNRKGIILVILLALFLFRLIRLAPLLGGSEGGVGAVDRGLFVESFLTIWTHGTLEISAIIIAGAAGLTMGRGLVFPGTLSRTKSFQLSARRGLKIMIGITPIIILAGFIEGFFTRLTDTPDIIRLGFILVCLTFILYYFVYLPWAKAKRGFDSALRHTKLTPDVDQNINFKKIKENGEIFSDVFVFCRKYAGKFIGISALLSAIYCTLLIAFSGVPIQDTFGSISFDSLTDSYRIGGLYGYFYAIVLYFLKNLSFLFRNPDVPFLPILNALLLTFVGFKTYHLLIEEARPKWKTVDKKTRNKWLGGIFFKTLLAGIGLAYFLSLGEWYVYFSLLAVFPFLMLWSFLGAAEQQNPLAAFGKVFKLFSGSLFRVIGLTAIFLVLGSVFYLLTNTAVFYMLMEAIGINFYGEQDFLDDAFLVVTVFISMWFALLIMFTFFASNGILYHTLQEITEAPNLRERIQNIGERRSIRGIEREG